MSKKHFIVCYIIVCCLMVCFASLSAEDNKGCGQIVSAVAPAYPRLARLTRASGKIRVEVFVDDIGTVISAKSLNENIDSYVPFRESAERAALRWRFTVGSDKGDQRKYLIAFNYRIMPDDTPEDELAPIFHYPYEIEVRNTSAKPIVMEGPSPYHTK